MDVLGTVLRELRFESTEYRCLRLGAPFRVSFAEPGLRGVHVVVHGHCEVSVDGRPNLQLGAGDLILFPRGDPHVLSSAGGGTGPAQSGVALAMAARPGQEVRAGGAGAETRILCGAFLVTRHDHPALNGLPRVVHVAASSAGQQPGLLRGLADPYVSLGLAAMHNDLARPWTVASVAAAAGMSRAAFAERFRERTGMAPASYLTGLRLARARTLLRDERSTLAAVAAQVGYGSEAAFSAAFRRFAGMAPGAYRRHPFP